MIGGLSKEVVSDEGKCRDTPFVISKAGLTKGVVFHVGGLSKWVLLYHKLQLLQLMVVFFIMRLCLCSASTNRGTQQPAVEMFGKAKSFG